MRPEGRLGGIGGGKVVQEREEGSCLCIGGGGRGGGWGEGEGEVREEVGDGRGCLKWRGKDEREV